MKVCPLTLKLKTLIRFIVGTTVLSLLIGILARVPGLALDLDIGARLPPPSPHWHLFVALTGLVIPIMVRMGYRHQAVRSLFNAYLIAFLAQIISELLLTPLFLRGISVIIGSLYSSFRLLQLAQGQAWIAPVKQLQWLRVYLWGLMGIWAINLGRFILYRWPLLLG